MSARIMAMLCAAMLVGACTDTGKVDQGKVIAFDAAQRIVTIARDGNTQTEVTYRLPDDPRDVGPLPETGDVVRIYYKEDGKARRFMNVTRTDIYKK